MKALMMLMLALTLSGCASRVVLVQPTIKLNYMQRMAILPFYAGSNADYINGANFADGIQTKLLEQFGSKLQLVERQRINDIINEWNLARDGIVDIQTAVHAGRLAGARVIMTGQIKSLDINRQSEMLFGAVRVSVRIIDVERGLLIWGKEVKVRAPGVWSRYQAYYDYASTEEFKADLIEKACDEIVKQFYEHKERING